MADTEKPDSEQSKTTASASTPPAVDAIVAAPALAVPAPSKGGEEAEETTGKVKARPEREPKPSDYFRVFTYAKPFDVACFVAAALASGCAGVTLPLMNVVFGQLIGQFNDFGTPNSTQTQGDFEALLNKQSIYLLALFVARFGLSYINKFAFRMMGIRLSSAIRLHYLQSLFGQTIHVLDSMPSGTAASTITATANVLQLGISEKLGVFIEFIATIIASLVVAFTYNWELTLVTSSVILFIFCVLGVLLPFILKGHGRMTKAEAKANSVASETFGGIRMITACGAEERITQKYAHWVQEARKHGQFTAPLIALQFGLIFFALFAAFGLCFWYGVKQVLEQRLDNVATVLIVLMSVMMIVISLERISSPLMAVGKAMVAACEFFTVIDVPKPTTGTLKEPDVTATNDLVFRDVTFAYPGRPHVKVLDGLDLTVEAGKLTAIVGPSGSGKSTIVGLIQRWYSLQDQYVIEKAVEKDKKKKKKNKKSKDGEPEKESSDDDLPEKEMPEEETGPKVELAGSITTAGGTPLDDIELKWWRSQIGLVQQEPFLFNDTIYQNVAYGLVGSEWADEPEERKRELVKEACKEAFADEFIDRLPDGYDTQVGDAGAKLSGGQRQRIAIARSIIRKPKILILDEATSAIDVRSEGIVQAALDRVARNRTTITIAHRLSTIKKADRIVVLQKGRLAETGTHDSLLQNPEGVYYGLVHAQQLSLGGTIEGAGEEEEDVKREEEGEMGKILGREKSAAKSDGGGGDAEVVGPKVGKSRNLFTSFGRLLYEQRSRFPSYVLTVFFAMVCAAGTPLQAYLFAKVVNVYGFTKDPPKFKREGDFWSLMWLVLAIAIGLGYFLMGFVATHLAHYISATYRQQYFESILFQKTCYFDFDDHSQGTLTSRVAGDPKQLEELLGINMAMVYTAVFGLIGALAIAFPHAWKISLVAFFVTVPLGIISMYWRFRYEVEFEKMNAAVFEESSKFASESIGAFRSVAAFTLEGIICSRYQALLSGHITTAYKKARWQSLIFAFSDSVSIGCQALIFWYGGGLLARREVEVVNYFIAFFAVIQGAEAAGQGLAFGPNAAQAAQASNRILNTRETRNRDAISSSEVVPDADGGVKIEMKDVHFKYPTRDVSVFKGLNLTIEKGEFAALVGASGCGKTSVISLLERFYDVGKGNILANGRDITEINVYEYRKNLSLVAQEATLFQGTIRDNVLLGVDPSSISENQLHHVCRDASIHDFIISLPEGYNTSIGSKGISLSGGQKQRLAIARALIRNPKILLLDEATSSLDSESEKLVQKAFERAGKGRTMVVVAHRLATVQNADVIFVLGEGGKLLEKGTHGQLLKNKGVYWNMCHSQALDR